MAPLANIATTKGLTVKSQTVNPFTYFSTCLFLGREPQEDALATKAFSGGRFTRTPHTHPIQTVAETNSTSDAKMSTKMDKPSGSRDDDDYISIAKLTVKTNFTRWQRDFRIVACSKDYWNLYTGQEQLFAKPNRHTYTVSTDFWLDMDMYDKQTKRARDATLSLYKLLDSVLRNILGSSFCGAPGEAFGAVKGHFRVSDTNRALRKAHDDISHVRISDFGTVSEHYSELLLCCQDIKDLGGECSDMQFKYHLVAGLDVEFKALVRPYIDERGVHITPNNASTTANDLFLRFLSYEAIRPMPIE
jgi:hypothetical protein